MEAFEQFVALALEAEGLVVSPAVKFPVTRLTGKAAYEERQTHGYEVDLVGARAGRLVLATVKSFFGSRGVASSHVTGKDAERGKQYVLLNDETVRSAVISAAAERYGYEEREIELHLYAGRFAAPKWGTHERTIREWCGEQHAGGGPIRVVGVQDVLASVQEAAAKGQYRDNPVLVTMKVLQEAGLLDLRRPA